MYRLMRIIGLGAVAGFVFSCPGASLPAADQSASSKPAAESVDMFAGMQSGDLQVKFIPKNDHEATIVVKNTTDQPLSVKLPDAFVGVPVLAQAAAGGGAGLNAGVGRTTTRSSGNQNQAAGGGGGGGFGGGGFNIPPEATQRIKLPIVCLEHGKKDPADYIPYEIRPLDTFTSDANVKELMTMLGSGKLNQQAAQAAAWHFANGMSWQELAAKKIHHTIGSRPDEQYFTPAEIRLAMQIASQAEALAKEHEAVAADNGKNDKAASKPAPKDRYSSDGQSNDSQTMMPKVK